MKGVLGCVGSLVFSLVVLPIGLMLLGVSREASPWAIATVALLILVGCLTWERAR